MPEQAEQPTTDGLDQQREALLKKLYTHVNTFVDLVADNPGSQNPTYDEYVQRLTALSHALAAVAINPRAPQGPTNPAP